DEHHRHAGAPAATGASTHDGQAAPGGHGHDHQVPTTFFGRIHHRIENFLDAATHVYQHLLTRALRHRFLVLGCVLALFVGALGPPAWTRPKFPPPVDAGQITIFLRAPSNLRLDATERRVAEVEKFITDVIPKHEMEMIVSELGLDPDWSAAYTANSGQQDVV